MLERRVRRLRTTVLVGAFSVSILGTIALTSRPTTPPVATVVTTKRLVLVDSLGNPHATIELGSAPMAGTPRPLDRSRGVSLEIVLSHAVPDSGQSAARATRGADALRIGPGPTLELTHNGRAVYQIDPMGGVRPVSASGR